MPYWSAGNSFVSFHTNCVLDAGFFRMASAHLRCYFQDHMENYSHFPLHRWLGD
jgi:hypothetical protein